MLEPKIALMRQIVFTHAARRLTDSLYTQIIVEGKIDDQLAEIEPCVFAALGCKDPATVGAECLKSAVADMKDSVQLGFDRAEQKLIECRDEIKSDIAAVDKKVSKLKHRGKRRGKYDDEVVSFCVACVDAAKGDATTTRGKSRTKLRLEDVFTRYRAKLRENGVEDFATFKKIIHAYRAIESRARIKVLAAKQIAAENGIIRDVKKTTTTWQRNS